MAGPEELHDLQLQIAEAMDGRAVHERDQVLTTPVILPR
jgi:hypothetical protein